MKELSRAVLVFAVFTALIGFAYPFAMTELAHRFFPKQAEGSLITSRGRVVGSSLIGQKFAASRYFHGRPSANSYDAINSGGSNLGPNSKTLTTNVKNRTNIIRSNNYLPSTTSIPADLVLASASGLDPHISREGALLQAQRVATSRQLTEEEVRHLIERIQEGRGVFGPERVNVLKINLALDSLKSK